MSAGARAKTGEEVSWTVIVNEFVVFSNVTGFVALQVTVVSPRGNTLPDGGLQVIGKGGSALDDTL
jgi:hypothetical protein